MSRHLGQVGLQVEVVDTLTFENTVTRLSKYCLCLYVNPYKRLSQMCQYLPKLDSSVNRRMDISMLGVLLLPIDDLSYYKYFYCCRLAHRVAPSVMQPARLALKSAVACRDVRSQTQPGRHTQQRDITLARGEKIQLRRLGRFFFSQFCCLQGSCGNDICWCSAVTWKMIDS